MINKIIMNNMTFLFYSNFSLKNGYHYSVILKLLIQHYQWIIIKCQLKNFHLLSKAHFSSFLNAICSAIVGNKNGIIVKMQHPNAKSYVVYSCYIALAILSAYHGKIISWTQHSNQRTIYLFPNIFVVHDAKFERS